MRTPTSATPKVIMSSGTRLIVRQNRIIHAFREVGATSPDTAIDPRDSGFGIDAPFETLVRRGVLREADAGRYYLDLEEAAVLQQHRRIGNLVMLAVVAALIALLWFSGVLR